MDIVEQQGVFVITNKYSSQRLLLIPQCQYISYSCELRFEYTGRKPDDSAFFDQAFQFLLQQFSIKSCYIKYDRYLIKILEKYNFHFVSTEMYDEDLLVYYPFGVLYKIEDITADKFYIGMTENLKMWDRYTGSGVALKAYLKKYPYKQNPQEGDHIYRKIILRDNLTLQTNYARLKKQKF